MAESTVPAIRVRMYRQGFGDCFLIRFQQGATVKHMLIDCGVHWQSPDAKKRIAVVVKNIRDETDKKLAVLVATHEHVDHVSAFQKDQLQDEFKPFAIEQTWLAWTENPHDTLASKLKTKYEATLKLLQVAMKAPGVSEELRGNLTRYSGFMLAANGSASTPSAMAWLRKSSDQVIYTNPFMPPLSVPDIPGVRVYVLGPPRDEDALRAKDPHANEGYRKLAFAQVLRSRGVKLPDDVAGENWAPFEERYLPKGESKSVEKHYKDPQRAWRTIDGAWQSSLPELALRMGDFINNTSMVLAIEIIATGDVLFFPADAQAGNWRSWAKGKFNVNGKTVTFKDLLNRTVLYKVSHHGSHNGTLKAAGLELMTSPKLTALLPLMDRPLGKGWKMPARELFTRLGEMCSGRVLLSDFEKGGTPKMPDSVEKPAWDQFRKQIDVQDYWIDWTYKP